MSDIEWPTELRTELMWLKKTIGAERLKKASAFIRNSNNTDREAVTRYRPIMDANGDAGMVPCAIGFWVTIDDYRDILAAKDQAEAENKAMVAALARSNNETAYCCVCNRIVDTRAVEDGGDTDGRQLSDGAWVCSSECWDVDQ